MMIIINGDNQRKTEKASQLTVRSETGRKVSQLTSHSSGGLHGSLSSLIFQLFDNPNRIFWGCIVRRLEPLE
jgi:hypothetical protein